MLYFCCNVVDTKVKIKIGSTFVDLLRLNTQCPLDWVFLFLYAISFHFHFGLSLLVPYHFSSSPEEAPTTMREMSTNI